MRRQFSMVALGVALSAIAPATALADTSPQVATSCPVVPAGESIHATVPPTLELLEKKLKHLRFNSIRLSADIVFQVPTATLAFDDLTIARLSPHESMSTLTLEARNPAGKSESETRRTIEIGDVTYKYEPSFTHGDGGRPWVRGHRERSRTRSHSVSWSPSLAQLAKAESILETGPATVDGRQVRQFTVTFAPGVFPKAELPFGEILEKACPGPVEIGLAIAPSGLPVRVSISANYARSGETVTTTDITQALATNFHFKALKPPPAKRTISEAALSRLQSAHTSKELKKLEKHKQHKR